MAYPMTCLWFCHSNNTSFPPRSRRCTNAWAGGVPFFRQYNPPTQTSPPTVAKRMSRAVSKRRVLRQSMWWGACAWHCRRRPTVNFCTTSQTDNAHVPSLGPHPCDYTGVPNHEIVPSLRPLFPAQGKATRGARL
jgi:hypothetical protein